MPPWEKYQTQAAPQQADPIVKPVDPYKASAEQRAQQDQQLQIEANARAARAEARAEASEARSASKDAQGTVEQNKAKGFLTRGLQANKDYLGLGEIEPRGIVANEINERFPNVANTYMNDPQRQKADQAERAFIAAILRYDSGAAIPPEEFVTQGRIYFPRPGDTPEVLEQKARARIVALQGLKDSAGPAAGSILIEEPPAEDQDAEGLSYANPGAGGAGVVSDEGAPPPSGPDDRDPSGLSGLGALAKQGLTLGLSDEAAGIGGYLSGFLTGEDPNKAYSRERETERAFLDKARKEWGFAGTAAEFIGGGGAARVSGLGSLGSVMRQGAGLGALGGFGYGEGASSVPNALLGAGLGAGVGAGLYGVARGVNALAPTQTPNMEVVAAGQRQNIPIRQADARPEMRGQYAAAESGQTSGPVIRQARADDVQAIEDRVAAVGGPGTASDPYALGSRVQEAGSRYIARTRQQANRLYDRARQEAGNATVTPSNADAVLDTHIQELRAAGENSNAAAISYLQGLRDDIDRGLTLDSVQNIRTNMRGQISERGLTGTDTERRVAQVIEAINQDMAEQLPQSASQALRAADDFYRQRQEFITGTLQQFMGSRGNPLPAETAAKRLVSMAQGKGNFERFSNMWRELEPAEQADAAATIAASLGRQANGNFSVATLIKSLDPRNGINPRTARLVFGDEGAQALQDLRVISQAKSEALNRQSPSGQTIAAQASGLKTLLMGALGFTAGGPGGAAAGAVGREFLARWGEQRAARMLLNPDFTRWLRNAPNTSNPQVIDRYFSRLGGSVAANDNQAFTTALREAFGTSPAHRAAAEERSEEREPVRREEPRR